MFGNSRTAIFMVNFVMFDVCWISVTLIDRLCRFQLIANVAKMKEHYAHTFRSVVQCK